MNSAVSQARAPFFIRLSALVASLACAWPAGADSIAIRKVALLGERAPGTEDGVTFSVFTTGLNHAIMRPVIDDDGRVAIIALVTGPGVDASNHLGIWYEDDDGLALTVRTGTEAPGTEDGVAFIGVPSDYLPFPPSVGTGHVAFAGTLVGPDVDSSNDGGVWSADAQGLEVVYRDGDPLPGMAGFTMQVGLSGITNAGHTFGQGSLNGPGVTTDNNDVIFTNRSGIVEVAVREGDPAPGTGPGVVIGRGTFGTSSTYPQVTFDDNGRLFIAANLLGPGLDAYNDEAVFIEDSQSGALTLLVREGDPAPGMAPQVTFGGNSVLAMFRSLSVNTQNQVVFNCRLGGSISTTTVMYSNITGTLLPVVVPGDPAPGTDFDFSVFGGALLNNAGKIAFSATLLDHDNDPFTNLYGIWWGNPDNLSPLVLPGDSVPDEPAGTTVFGASYIEGLNDQGQVAFVATLDHPTISWRSVLMLAEADGSLHTVVGTGESFDVAGDGSDMRTVQRVQPGGLSQTGAVAFRLDFTDGSSGHFVASLEPDSVRGDMDGDGDVDPADYQAWQGCLLGPEVGGPSGCETGDLDGDGDVDLADFAGFQQVFQ